MIPPEQLFTGKDLTFPIEQDNSNVRHCLARVRRQTKVVSKCRVMVDLSLRLLHHLQHPANYAGSPNAFELSLVRNLRAGSGACLQPRLDP